MMIKCWGNNENNNNNNNNDICTSCGHTNIMHLVNCIGNISRSRSNRPDANKIKIDSIFIQFNNIV
jgi:hypothetical protein